MTENVETKSVADSALFAERDYVGMFRRFVIVVVDGLVVALAWPLVVSLWYDAISPATEPYRESLLTWTGFIFVYLVILKPSRVRSAGLWVTGTRIVDHRGNQPSIVRMSFRLLLWLLGPVNPTIDLLWLGGDRHRQTLRDKFAGTYVVNVNAEPIARSHRKGAWYNFLGATFFFWEIQSPEQPIADEP